MTKQERTRRITRRLAKAYPDAHVTLEYTTPFQFAVSVILSAQCTDKKVNEVMAPHYKKYRTAKDFAAIPLKQLEQMVKPTGFYHSKARAIHETAVRVRDVYKNQVPIEFDELLTLRGIARKSANVISSEMTGKAQGIIVDTHVTRLANRLGLTKKTNAVQIERELMKIVPKKDWHMFPHYLVWHGRAVCTAQRPACDRCPLNDICPSAFQFSPWRKNQQKANRPLIAARKN